MRPYFLVALALSCGDAEGSIDGLPPDLAGNVVDAVLVDRGGSGLEIWAVDVDVTCPLPNRSPPAASWSLFISDVNPGIDRELVGTIVADAFDVASVDVFGRLRIDGSGNDLTATIEIDRTDVGHVGLNATGTLHPRPCAWP